MAGLQQHLAGRRVADPGLRQPDRGLTDDLGAGLISALFGVTLFLVLLFFAVHLLLGLHATSVVTAVTWDAARIAAEAGGDVGAAEDHARSLLGGRSAATTFVWGEQGDAVTLTVRSDNPDLLWPGLMGALGTERIERTVTVRREGFRGPD